MVVFVENTDENADWIKWRTDDIQVSETAKRLLKKKGNSYSVAKRGDLDIIITNSH